MKYVGSKRRLAKDLKVIINNLIVENSITTYVEPFVGGLNMIEHIKCDRLIGNDNHKELISLWKHLLKGGQVPEMITREEYISVKNSPDNYPEWYVGAVGFLASYNGKYFGGYAGEVNTKGGIRNYYKEALKNVNKQVKSIGKVELTCGSYLDLNIPDNSLVYCDPPYAGTLQYSTSKHFKHDDFWVWVREVSKNNIVLVSEYNAPEDFKCIYKKELKTTMDNNSRKKDTEKVFTFNY